MDVSIIIPVYNVGDFLEEAIESLLNQKSDVKYEIIIVNDASTDNTSSILKKYNDSKIKVLNNSNNLGPGASRNKGIEKAKGKYLMFVDGDDYVSPNFVDVMYNQIIKNKADICICNIVRLENEKETIWHLGDKGIYKKGDYNKILLMKFHSCNKIFKRELLENNLYPANMFFEDVVAVSKSILDAKRIVKIDDALYYYRRRKTSITNELSPSNFDIIKALEMIENKFLESNYREEIEYLYVNDILNDLIIKIFWSKDDRAIEKVDELLNKVNNKYPNWHKNKILKNQRLLKRLYFYFLRKKYYSFVRLIIMKIGD